MKFNVFTLSILICTINWTFADNDTTLQQQANLNQLQAQINTLQMQVNNLQPDSQSGVLGLDTAVPFGTLSKVQMPEALLTTRGNTPPALVLGGQVETDLQYWNGSNITTTSGTNYNANSSALSLSRVYLFNEANIGPHALGMISFINGRPSQNIQLDRAFLLLGNLNASHPFYITAGSTYLPFGAFSGNGPLDNALTTNLFRISPTDQLIANYGQGPFLVQAGTYSNNSTSVNNSINGLTSILFNDKIANIAVNLGASYLSNIVGTNSEAGVAFNNGTASSTTPLNSSTNPAYDFNFSIGIAPFSVIGEYVSTLRSVNNNDVNVGTISSWMLGTVGKFALMSIPYNWQLSYSATRNLQNVPMALDGDYQQNYKYASIKNEWLASIQGEYWQNVYLGPELDYDDLYNNAGHTYTLTFDATAYF